MTASMFSICFVYESKQATYTVAPRRKSEFSSQSRSRRMRPAASQYIPRVRARYSPYTSAMSRAFSPPTASTSSGVTSHTASWLMDSYSLAAKPRADALFL